jgi:hypothetical protein
MLLKILPFVLHTSPLSGHALHTAQNTPLSAALLLLGDVAIRMNHTENTVALLCVQSFLLW